MNISILFPVDPSKKNGIRILSLYVSTLPFNIPSPRMKSPKSGWEFINIRLLQNTYTCFDTTIGSKI